MKKVEWGIFRYPLFLNIIPLLDTSIAHALYPFIYLPNDLYDRLLKSGEDDADVFAVILHEREHLLRMKNAKPYFVGSILFIFRYILGDKKFILAEELAAIEVEMRYRKSRQILYDIERKASQFSGALYDHLLSHDEAIEVLKKKWSET
jgi:hypothetical protein